MSSDAEERFAKRTRGYHYRRMKAHLETADVRIPEPDLKAITRTRLFCGKCMNSSVFVYRVIVPRHGACDCCGDVGTIWELGGVSDCPTKEERS